LGFHLCISLYPEKDTKRYEELMFCLHQNINLSEIKKIHIFDEGVTHSSLQALSPKISIYPIYERPTYHDFFKFANEHLIGEKVIIANSDIFFDSTLALILDHPFENIVFALTRYNLKKYLTHLGKPWERHHGSQDAWIFLSPIKEFYSDIKLGWFGCDNWIAWEMHAAGLQVSNPSLSIFTWHVHENPKKEKTGVPIGAGNYHSQIRGSDGTWLKGKFLPLLRLKDIQST